MIGFPTIMDMLSHTPSIMKVTGNGVNTFIMHPLKSKLSPVATWIAMEASLLLELNTLPQMFLLVLGRSLSD
jgi:hypothetical protein